MSLPITKKQLKYIKFLSLKCDVKFSGNRQEEARSFIETYKDAKCVTKEMIANIQLSAGNYAMDCVSDNFYDEYGTVMSCDDADYILEDARQDIILGIFGEDSELEIKEKTITQDIKKQLDDIIFHLDNTRIEWDTQLEESEWRFNSACNQLNSLKEKLNSSGY